MANKVDDIVKKVLVSERQIKKIAKKLGKQISKDYEGKDLIVVGLLKGCAPFMMELIKHITIPLRIDFVQVSSYEGTKSTNNVKFKKDLETNIEGKHVLLVDDILDTAQTITSLLSILADRGAASIELCCLLDKPEGRIVQYDAKYIGKSIPKEFVIGYGLDYDEFYRNLPYIAIVKDEVYK
jgi:hypoxanthine phosphoribosyltransferase